jgi:hypothetical protein
MSWSEAVILLSIIGDGDSKAVVDFLDTHLKERTSP